MSHRVISLRRFHVRLVKKWSSFCMNLFFPPVPRNWRLIVRALQPLERRAINNLSRRFLHVGFMARSKGYATPDGHVSASGTGFHEDGRSVRIEVRGPTKACREGDDWGERKPDKKPKRINRNAICEFLNLVFKVENFFFSRYIFSLYF